MTARWRRSPRSELGRGHLYTTPLRSRPGAPSTTRAASPRAWGPPRALAH